MELNEIEKRMLYQTEGSERYAILHELLMASRYAKDPDRRRAADSLIEKLRPLLDKECMEIVHDIRRNYRLPKEGRTIGGLIAETRQESGAEQRHTVRLSVRISSTASLRSGTGNSGWMKRWS